MGQEADSGLDNGGEKHRLPLRRLERTMLRLRQTRHLHTFAAVHVSVRRHFNPERQLYRRTSVKHNRSVALTE